MNLVFVFFIFIVFKDQNTPSPFVETFPEDDGEAASAALPDHIYMDAMGFGMGNCCLQVNLLPSTTVYLFFYSLQSGVKVNSLVC